MPMNNAELMKVIRRQKAQSLERHLMTQIKQAKIPMPAQQYKAFPNRKYLFDFAWTDYNLLVEVQGGTWNQGAHARGLGITRDCKKMNQATLLGWLQFHFTSDMIKSGEAILTLMTFFKENKPKAKKIVTKL